MANIELERELASGDDEIKTLTKKLNELEMFKKGLDEEDLRLAKMSENQERELQRLDQQLVHQQTEIYKMVICGWTLRNCVYSLGTLVLGSIQTGVQTQMIRPKHL